MRTWFVLTPSLRGGHLGGGSGATATASVSGSDLRSITGEREPCAPQIAGRIVVGHVAAGLSLASRNICRIGRLALALIAGVHRSAETGIHAGNAASRYVFSESSNGWLEIQWYMFAGMVLLGAPYTLKMNEHVRVDLFYMTLGRRGQLWIDILGTLVFLLPTCIILAWLSWPFFMQSFAVGEHSSNAGGLLRWPIKLVLPVGFLLVALQGLSELIKRVAFLNGIPVESLEAHYERPTQ